MLYDPVRKLVIETTNKCSLQCSKCGRAYLLQNKMKVPGENLTVERFEKLTDYFDEFVEFCGNYSDPVMNPNLKNFLNILHNKKIPSKVSTAASYRDLTWYENLYRINPNTEWVFGLDGLPEESHIYRKGQDGNKIFQAMKLAAEMNINVTWQYIVFRYNENHIDKAVDMAKKNNIRFQLNISSRFDDNDPLKPLNPIYVKEHGTKQAELFS